ncbi:DUF4349 domain-containing protein [Kitasatospora sp. GP82]|uniref:DUF4349 domain-containing protein n=1 Tax=Kitasatospora sp. GP82 TaxID=3035089 RepID=UPI0024740870|nr:DUF4349 domain-containing protein [Kitasatospora sp. GP82]MDH6127875.1 hypothetical protein [Kitasatospora sp. GP82]
MAHRGRRPALAAAGSIAVTAALLLGGCSGSSGGSARPAAARGDAAAGAAQGPAKEPARPGAGAPSPAPSATGPSAVAARLISYTGQITVATGNVDKTADDARALAETTGGYVADESVTGAQPGPDGEPASGGSVSAHLTLKVPSASYEQTFDRVAGLGTVETRSSQAEDLTQQVVDIDSRLKSQQASVDRVRALMAEARSLSDVVSLESELSRREADLESLQHQQQELSGRTSLSTITLQLQKQTATPAARPGKADGFWSSVGGALVGGWDVLVAILRGLLIACAALAPFLLLLAPLGALAWHLLRRRRQSRPGESKDGDEPTPAAE